LILVLDCGHSRLAWGLAAERGWLARGAVPNQEIGTLAKTHPKLHDMRPALLRGYLGDPTRVRVVTMNSTAGTWWPGSTKNWVGRVRTISDGLFEEPTPTHGGFRFFDGGHVKTRADWDRRREEIKALLQYYEFGRKPESVFDDDADAAGGGGAFSTAFSTIFSTSPK
jgi:hypothetical protein